MRAGGRQRRPGGRNYLKSDRRELFAVLDVFIFLIVMVLTYLTGQRDHVWNSLGTS